MNSEICIKNKVLLTLAVIVTGFGSTACAPHQDLTRVTVSGISAGGYMAVQSHIALSSTIEGAAVLAGGPYHCAEGQIGKALTSCISGTGLEVAPLITATGKAADEGLIDPLDNLANDRVWLFHGQLDPVVSPDVNAALASFYGTFLTEGVLHSVEDIPVTHGWPTVDQGNACDVIGGDFINACDYDAAGALLQHLYGPMNSPESANEGNLRQLDQTVFATPENSLADVGFVYVPDACSGEPAQCRLHVAFHGCRQGQEFIGDHFAVQVGLNDWAESNRIVVLYPQINASPVNPQGCWDWWGYTGPDYDQKVGKQVNVIAALIEAWSE